MVLYLVTAVGLDLSLGKYQFFAYKCFSLDNNEVKLLESVLNLSSPQANTKSANGTACAVALS